MKDKKHLKQITIENVKVRLFDPKRNKPYVSSDDPTFSKDVFIIDEDGVHGLAYFCFESDKWRFHTDTLVDYDEEGAETKWMWYYPVVNVDNIVWEF